MYNAGVHSFKNNQGYCYVWAENQAGGGAQKIGSCLIKHIDTKVKSGMFCGVIHAEDKTGTLKWF